MRAKNKVFWLFLIFLCLFSYTAQADAIRVASTIEPISDLIRQVAGEGHEVLTILPAGANPHTFEMSPRMIRELSAVQMVFTVGVGFDDWVKPLFELGRGMQRVPLNTHIQLIEDDPHYWLSIHNAKIIARNVADGLIQLKPESRQTYEANLTRLNEKLDALFRDIQTLLSEVSNKEILTYHDSWYYFARDFDLQIVATVEDYHDSEPTPRRLITVNTLVQRYQIKALFAESNVNLSFAESVARDLSLTLYQLDSLGFRPETKTFSGLMLNNAEVMAEALAP